MMKQLAVLLLLSCPAAAAQAPPGDPDAPFLEAQDLLWENRHAEAHTLLLKARETWRRRGDRHREALGRLLQGMTEIGKADNIAAVASLADAARSLEALGDRFGAWGGLYILASLETHKGRSADAVTYTRQGLALLRELAASRGRLPVTTVGVLSRLFPLPEAPDAVLMEIAEMLSRDVLIDALLRTRQLDEAEAELPRLAALSRRLGGTLDAKATLQEAKLRDLQERPDEARQLFQRALESTTPTPEAPLRTRDHEREILETLAVMEILRGRPEEALPWTSRAVAMARERGASHNLTTALQIQAEALEKCQRYEEAETTLGEALDLMRKTGNLARQAQLHEQLGIFALRADRLEKAVLHLETAVSLFRAVRLPSAESHAWRNLAMIYTQLDARGSARMARQKARELAGESGAPLDVAMVEMLGLLDAAEGETGTRDIARILTALLELPEIQDVQDEKVRELRSLFSILGPGVSSTATPTDLSPIAMAFVHYSRGEFAAARDQILIDLEKRPEKDREIPLRALLGSSLEQEGKYPEALREFTRALDLTEERAEGLRIEELLAGYLGSSSQQRLFEHVIELQVREGRTVEALDTSEKARARAFLQSLGGRPSGPETGGDAHLGEETETLRRQILELEKQILTAPTEEKTRLVAELHAARQRYEALRIRLKASNPEHASLAQIEPLPLAAVQRSLPADVTLISYFVTDARVHAWVVDRESAEHAVLPVRPGDLQRGLCWADRMSYRGRGRSVRLREPQCSRGHLGPKALYRKLFSPLARRVRHEKLILVPHGDLHYLPFAALRNPETGRYLIEDHTLILAPSASVLHVLQSKETPVTGTALVLGAPDELDPDLPPLPGARREARQVASLLGTSPLLGAQATEDRLRALHGEADLLHIAAHGIYDPESPLFSRIALAPGETHDGFLEVHEILSGLDLSGVNLVVLSACQTARGRRSGGDEVTGLTRAFLSAGTPGVISTLWNIDDAASALLMRNLYRHLLDGAPAAEALRTAQLDLLRNSRYRNPYYWAAFTLTGNPQGRFTR